MLQAVHAPVGKLTVIGGAALALALAAGPRSSRTAEHWGTHSLTLHAASVPDAIYLSVFDHGDITLTRDDAHLVPFAVTTRGEAFGCSWLAVEHFTPIDAHYYTYSYDEQLLSCSPGAPEVIATPRSGYVTVDK